ncbi:MAG: hypothetical protein U9R17_08150 [Thermodesulfobacteriota bacterium]|nr:hypothetical protein [Thermodesulfobacteriota bacterium]
MELVQLVKDSILMLPKDNMLLSAAGGLQFSILHLEGEKATKKSIKS